MPYPFFSRRLRLGMIGGGPGSLIGPVHRIGARLDDRWSLEAGAFSSDAARNAEAGRECFVAPDRCYDDWREMIRAEASRGADRLDAISIVTPNHLHAGPAIAALEAGFHVICDKPLAATLAEADAIAAAARASDRLFALTHTYTGYPMVRQARRMVQEGRLGRLRIVQIQYAQDWLSRALEKTDNRQAGWRTDPTRSGAGGCLGDIGTHGFHLAHFVTGLRAEALLADLSAFGEGRVLDDNVHMLLRYPDGVRGMLWATQVAPGKGNGVRIGVYGTEGGVEWFQEQPNQLRWTPTGEAARILERGGADDGTGRGYTTRTAPYHPEGYLEAFAQLYEDAAELIAAREENRAPDPIAALLPGIEAGIDGMEFVAGALASHQAEAWIAREHWAIRD
ncbi:Gfo/Idh/MocA family protein [Rhizosaccharibacter radicis]|uniref:Gfo/Idh/MocA family oxidoreductase n=1 Tax=Rhizosaccharibacter radicis TaxID=2782605 RepID=A0ABT1W1E2_9PROT|nr:Gfo/Idh/MocA family oxidoreductase [Acetobacteraceae bacterium KSS12]